MLVRFRIRVLARQEHLGAREVGQIGALEVVLLPLEGAPGGVEVEAGLAVRRARGVLAGHVVGDVVRQPAM